MGGGSSWSKNFVVFYVVKKFLGTNFFSNHGGAMGTPPLTKFYPSGSNPPSTEKHLADVWFRVG